MFPLRLDVAAAAVGILLSLSNLVYSVILCGVCPPGNYVAKQCTQATSRVCEPCPSGKYMDSPNMRNDCFRCKACDVQKQTVSAACNATHNTVCKCAPGHFYNGGLLTCMSCKKCGPGSGVVQKCTTTSNTVCGRCVLGETFSPVRSSTELCHACKRCQTGEIVMKNCTRRRNQQCEVSLKQKLITQNKSKLSISNKSDKDQNHRLKSDLTTTNYRTFPGSPTVDPTEKIVGTESKADLVHEEKVKVEQIVMYILVVLVVLVFLGLVMYFCVCSKRRRDHKTHSRHPPDTRGASKQTKQHLVVKIEGNRLSTLPLVNGPQADKMLRDVSYSLIDELSRLLNPNGRWKTLAGRLQFTELDVQNLNIKPDVATSQLLSSWGQRSDSTLGALYEVTMTLGWDSEGSIIGKYILDPSQ